MGVTESLLLLSTAGVAAGSFAMFTAGAAFAAGGVRGMLRTLRASVS